MELLTAATLVLIFLALVVANYLIFLYCARRIGRTDISRRAVLTIFLLLGLISLVMLGAPESSSEGLGAGVLVGLAGIVLQILVLWRGLKTTLLRAAGVFALSTFLGAVLGVGTALVVRTTLIEAFRVPSGSMKPTFEPNDLFMAVKNGPILRGDCVVFPHPNAPLQTYFKRVVGMPGDLVQLQGKQLTLNGTSIDEPYVQSSGAQTERRDFGPVRVPEGALFVLGDNRDNSRDSRHFGFIDLDDIRGRAWFVYSPAKRARVLPRRTPGD